jgi:hypothetical protein
MLASLEGAKMKRSIIGLSALASLLASLMGGCTNVSYTMNVEGVTYYAMRDDGITVTAKAGSFDVQHTQDRLVVVMHEGPARPADAATHPAAGASTKPSAPPAADLDHLATATLGTAVDVYYDKKIWQLTASDTSPGAGRLEFARKSDAPKPKFGNFEIH